MKPALILLLSSMITSQAEDASAQRSRLVKLVTPVLAMKFAFDGEKPGQSPETKIDGQKTQVRFETFMVTVAPGGSLLTAKEIAAAKKQNEELRKQLAKLPKADKGEADVSTLLAEILADDANEFPKIGLRARATDFMGQTLTFTTSDGRFDVHIEDAEPYSLRICEFAAELAKSYDRKPEE